MADNPFQVVTPEDVPAGTYAEGFARGMAGANALTDRAPVQDTAVGILDTLQSIGSIPLAVLPEYELADAARNSQILDQFRSAAYLEERINDAIDVDLATQRDGEWAGLIEGAKNAATGGNTFADVMAQSPYLMIGPAARAMGFAAAAKVPGVLGKGLAAVGGEGTGAIANRVAALSGVLEATGSYGQTYERVLRETGDVEEATRQAQIAGGTALAAGVLLGRATPGFEMDPLGRRTNITSQFLGDAILPTATAIGAEVIEEGGMALTNTVTDNVLNGRDPMEGVGGAVGEAAAISSLFTGGLRSPALIRDTGKAIGVGVLKGLGAAGSAFAGRAQTPEGAATKAAREANAAAVDEVLQAAVGTEGGDPASTGASTETAAPTQANTSEDNTTQPRESASIEDEDQLDEEERQYQLRQGARTTPAQTNSDADQVVALAETENLANDDGSVESAAAAERAAELAPNVAEAEQRVFDFSSNPEQVAEVVAKADAGDVAAQEQVEAIAVVNPLVLPNKTFPKPLRPLVKALRALKKEDETRAKEGPSEGTLRTRDQILSSGWANTKTGKRVTRRHGMTEYVNNILQSLARGGSKDSDKPTNQAVTAAAFLQHLRERGTLFANALKLREELREQGAKHPYWQKSIENGNAIVIEGTQTLDADGKLSGKPFILHLSARGEAKSLAVVEAVVEDVISAEKKWEAFEKQFPKMAAEAGRKAELQREKVKDIMAFRKKTTAPADTVDSQAEALEKTVIEEIGKSKDTKRLKALSDRIFERAKEGKLPGAARDRIRKAYDTRMQELLSDKIKAATDRKALNDVAGEIGGLGQEVTDSVKAALRKEWRTKTAQFDAAAKAAAAEKKKKKAVTPPPQPTAPATPAPAAVASATDKPNIVLRIAKVRENIKAMLPNIKWAQVGGELIIDGEGKKSRSKWLADPAIDPWWSRDLGLSMEKTQALFAKLASGKYNPKTLGANQITVITAYLDWVETNLDAEKAARKQEEENRAENERDAQLEREGREIDARAAEEKLARERARAQSAGVPNSGTDSDTGQQSATQSQENPLSKITNWVGNVLEYFTIDPANTLEAWVQKFKDAGRLGSENIYDALYSKGIEETYQLLNSIVYGPEGIGKLAKGEEWRDKPYGVGSYLWVPGEGTTYTDADGNTVTTESYKVPEAILRAFAVAGVIVLYKNSVAFTGITNDKDMLTREVQKEAVAAEIAKVAMKLLGISGKKSTSISVDQGVFLSYGLSTVAALIAGKNFEMNFDVAPEAAPADAWTNANLKTVMGSTEEGGTIYPIQIVVPTSDTLKLAKKFADAIDQVQGVMEEERIWEVSNEPITEVDQTIQYDNTPLSSVQETAQTNLQGVKHTLFQGFYNFYSALGDTGMTQALTGWWGALPDAEDGTVPETVREWLESQTARLANEFRAIKKYMEVTENGAKGLFFKYHFGLNGRPKTVNGPQNLKVVRDLFSSGETVLDLTNEQHRRAITMALAQAFGIKTDINSPDQVMEIWNGEKFAPTKAKWARLAKQIQAAKKPDGSYDRAALMSALKQDKAYSPRELAAVITLSEMLENPQNTAFKTHLMFEIDGKTNGAFNTELFFGLAVHNYANLAQGGLFPGKHDATWGTERAELERQGGGLDFYERLNRVAEFEFVQAMVKGLKAAKQANNASSRYVLPNYISYLRLLEAADLVEVQWNETNWTKTYQPTPDSPVQSVDVKGLPIFTFKRDAAKFAVIPIQYGAGTTGIANQLWSDVVKRINSKWIAKYNQLQRTQDKAERTRLIQDMNFLKEQLLGWDARGKDPSKLPREEQTDAYRWQQGLGRLARAMGNAYANEKPIVKRLTDHLVQITSFAFAVKKYQWDMAVEKLKREMPENQALIAKYGEKVRLFEPSTEQLREAMKDTISMRFSVLNAPGSVNLNQTEWETSGVQVGGIGTPMDANLDVPTLAEPGVSILALMTIAGGDAAMGNILFQLLRQVTHVYDGYDIGVLDVEEVGNVLNEGVWQTAMFNILEDVGVLLDKMEYVVKNSSDAAIAEMTENYNDTLPEGITPVGSEGFVLSLATIIAEFENLYRNQRVGQRLLESQPNTVYQMGGSGKGFNSPVRDSAALDDEFQLSLEEDTPRQEVTDLSQVGEREQGLFKDQRKEADATRLEDENGLIDVVMKGPRWRGTNSFTPDNAEPDTWKRDGLSHGLRRLVKVLHMAANAGVVYDSDQSVSPDAIKMYLRGKRAGIITFDSPYTDKQLEDAVAGGRTLRTTDASTFTGPSVFSNVRLVGREAITTRTANPTIQSAFDLTNNRLNKANVIEALDQVKWKNPIHRVVWKRIRNLLPEALLVVLATTPEQWLEGSKVTGTRRAFNSVTGVAIGSNILLRVPSAETMLHELLHTIFTKHIDNFFTNINLVPVELRGPINDLVQLMEKFKTLPGIGRVGFIQKVMRSYAFRGQPQDELGEMLAYVFTEERIINELSPGFIERVKTRIKQIIGYITKVPVSTRDFYNEAMDVFRQLTDNVPVSADLVDSGPVRMSDRLVDNQFDTLMALTQRAYETLVNRAAHSVNVDFTGLQADVDNVMSMVQTVYQLNADQDKMFRRIYGLLRHGPRGAELEQFVSTTLPQHAQKNLFNKAPDAVAATLALAAVEPTFAAQLDALWGAREEQSKSEQVIDYALNGAQQESSRDMINNAIAGMLMDTEVSNSFYGTAASRLDRLGSTVLNRLGELAYGASEKAPKYVDDGLYIIGALLNEKRASAFGEALLGHVNTKMNSQAVRDLVAALLGTKGSGKLTYRAHNAMMTLINQTRSMFDNTLPRELSKLFPADFDGWSRLYNSFGQLDVAVLGTSTERMYRDDAERRRMIEVLKAKVDNWIDAENLGYFLVHHDIKPNTTLNLLRNARAIASNLNGVKQKPSDELVADVDQLVTLFAIEALPASERAAVANYFTQHRDSMNKLVGMLKHIKDTELADLDPRYENVTWKVSLPLSTDPRNSTVIGNSVKGATLLALGYTRGEKYPQSSGDPESDLYYYHRKWSPPPVFTQGIVATVQQTMMGINFATAASITPEVGTMLASRQAINYINRHKGRGSKLIPIHNLKGDVAGYERLLDPAIVRKTLGAGNTMLHVSIGKKLGRITEEKLAKQINQEAIKIMYDTWKADEEAGRGDQYEAVNSTTDKQVARAWENIPGPIKAQLEDAFEGQVMVRRDLLANTIGYHNAGVLEIYTGDASLDPKTRKMMLGLLQTVFFGPKGTQILLAAEQAIKEGVATAKDLIIVRSMVVAWQNMQASAHLVLANGVPPAKIIKFYREGMADVRSYNRLQREVMQLRIQIAGTTNPVEQERLRAQQLSKRNAIRRLRIYPLIEAGELSDLPEGLEESPSHSYLGDLAGWMNNHLRQIHPKAPAAVANALLAKDSAIHDALSKTIQAGDFLARYAIYQHMIEQGADPEKARDDVRDELVSYQTNPGRMRAALESYGMIWWSQFTLRAQNVLLNRFRKNPFSFFVSQALGDFMGTPGPLDGAIYERGLDNSLGLDQVISSPMAHIYAKVY